MYNFITIDTNNFTTEQEARWDRIHTNDEYVSFRFIEMTDFVRDNNYDGVLTTPITDTTNLEFDFKYVTDKPNRLVWYGEYAYKIDSVHFWGNLLYIDDESGKFGTFSTESNSYEIIDMSGDLQILALLDTTEDHSTCGFTNSIDQGDLDLPKIISREPSPCQIQIFATYTEAAADKVASIEQKAKLDIEIANAVLKNSDVSMLEAEFVYLGNSELMEFEFTPLSTDDDEAELESSDELDEIRDEFYADIIIVYVHSDWVPKIHGMAGDWEVAVANTPDPPLLKDAWVAYNIKKGIKKRLFAHEAGHIIGARHEITDDDEGAYQHAHRFDAWLPDQFPIIFKKKVRTVMWSTTNKYHIAHYSNPDINFLGQPTGTSTANNALKIMELGCATSELVTADYPLSVYIDGPVTIEYQTTEVFTAFPYAGITPYDYDWYISFDGINYQTLNDTDDEVSIPANYPEGTFFILKVNVKDDADEEESGFLTVRVTDGEIDGLAKPNMGSILTFIPNPSTHELIAEFYLNDNDKNISLNIFNANGTIANRYQLGQLEKGTHRQKIDVSNILPGIFFISLLSGDDVLESKQAVKINQP